MAKKLSEQTVRNIVDLIERGTPYKQIREKLGVSQASVVRCANKYVKNKDIHKENSYETRRKLIEALSKDRLTMSRPEVAKKHGVSESTVFALTRNHPLRHQFKRKHNKYYGQERWEQAIKLKEQGMSHKEIAEALDMNLGSLKSALGSRMGIRRPNLVSDENKEEIYNQVAKDRLTMSIDKVAEKWGKSRRWVSWISNKRATEKPDQPYFVKQDAPRKKSVKPRTEKPKVLRKKKVGKPEPEEPKIIIKDQGPKRPVVINSKTTIYVKVDDKRTTEQIIKDYNKKYNL